MPASDFAVGRTFTLSEPERLDSKRIIAFAQAGADASPSHLSDEEAKAVGFPRALAHGMIGMAFLGRLIEHSFPHSRLRSLRARFVAMTYHDDLLWCTATVEKVDSVANIVELALSATNQNEQTVLAGSATVSIE